MKLDNSTLKTTENILRVGLLDGESFKDQSTYLDEANSSFRWKISTQFVTPTPSLCFDSNGIPEWIPKDLGFLFRRMKYSICLRLIYTFKIPKITLKNLQKSYVEVRWNYNFSPKLNSELAHNTDTSTVVQLMDRLTTNGPSFPFVCWNRDSNRVSYHPIISPNWRNPTN